MKAHREKAERAYREGVTQHYVGAWLHRVEKFPTLQSIFDGDGDKRDKLNHEAVAGHLKAMTAKMPKKEWSEWLR